MGGRLDWFYTPQAWRPRISRHTCSPFVYSDQHLIKLQVTLRPTSPPGMGGMEIQHAAAQKQKFLRHI